MQTLNFDTAHLPAVERLAAFRAGATSFEVDVIGDPCAFSSRWRLLRLGELNALHSHISPVRYRRTPAAIESDGEDRIAIHCRARGTTSGLLDGIPVTVPAGAAAVWDLSRPVDLASSEPVEVFIVTAPRYMFEEVLAAPSYACVLPASPELMLAAEQLRHMIDHAEELPEEGAPFYGRALRDLFELPRLRRSTAPRGAPRHRWRASPPCPRE